VSDDVVNLHDRFAVKQQSECEPTETEVEAAARAWLSWQFPGREWDTAVESMRNRFRDGAKVVLRAAALALKENARDIG